MDILNVKGIRGYGYTGYFDAEQTLGQWFEVDLTFWLDLSVAGKSDDLNDTLDYGKAAMITQNIIKTSKFKMVERLADEIANAMLDLDGVNKVKVCLTKCQPPIPEFEGEIQLEIVRSRP
ncbi:MAG: dihydroneopterin aldolase [Leptolyngbyaceae bacterium]|nr:dihydroneopterin aldolase [Leptolyngbyaceae bacterium]